MDVLKDTWLRIIVATLFMIGKTMKTIKRAYNRRPSQQIIVYLKNNNMAHCLTYFSNKFR